MKRFWMVVLLAATVAIMAGNVWAQSNLFLRLTQIDASGFPNIETYVSVYDSSNQTIAGLTENNFTLTEQSTMESSPTEEYINVTEIDTAGGVSIALVLDVSGSMGGQPLIDLKSAANNFVDLMAPLDRIAIISFSDSPVLDMDFTSNQASLHAAIDSLEDGGGTYLFDAICFAVVEAVPEIGVKAIIAMTDGNSSGDLTDAIECAQNANIPVYTIGLGDAVESVLDSIANATDGEYYYAPTSDQLDSIYAAISAIIRSGYMITYRTHNPELDGQLRTVCVTVDYAGETASDCGTYMPQGPPRIVRTPETISCYDTTINEGTEIHIQAWIVDDGTITEARLFYRQSGSGGGYSYINMLNTGDSLYEATIPGTAVNRPGVDYYITATDDASLTATSPDYYPTIYPHVIAVWPNYKPIIIHTPVSRFVVGSDIQISCSVIDSTDSVVQVSLFYRNIIDILYEVVQIDLVSGDEINGSYHGAIPSAVITSEDDTIEYYIMAVDNYSVAAYFGSSDVPLQIINDTIPPLDENAYAYPNPFNPDYEIVKFCFELTTSGNVTIKIYDVAQNLARTVVNNELILAGEEQLIEWNGRNGKGDIVANGTYFYIIESNSGEKTIGKVSILR